jgi:hypothetical protein
VHRNDLVIATMGRSAWIMDNITPLQELARIVTRRRRDGRRLWLRADEEQQKLPAIALFQPREAMRMRNSGAPASANEPEYPTMGAQFDLYFASAPGADTKLEVLDAKGGALKTWSVLAPRSAGRA